MAPRGAKRVMREGLRALRRGWLADHRAGEAAASEARDAERVVARANKAAKATAKAEAYLAKADERAARAAAQAAARADKGQSRAATAALRAGHEAARNGAVVDFMRASAGKWITDAAQIPDSLFATDGAVVGVPVPAAVGDWRHTADVAHHFPDFEPDEPAAGADGGAADDPMQRLLKLGAREQATQAAESGALLLDDVVRGVAADYVEYKAIVQASGEAIEEKLRESRSMSPREARRAVNDFVSQEVGKSPAPPQRRR